MVLAGAGEKVDAIVPYHQPFKCLATHSSPNLCEQYSSYDTRRLAQGPVKLSGCCGQCIHPAVCLAPASCRLEYTRLRDLTADSPKATMNESGMKN